MGGAAETAEIAANVARVCERIARAAARAGRKPEDIRLVAAAKQQPPEKVQAAVAAGIADIGENYVQEAAAKREQVVGQVRWHLIGHLQRNKAGPAARIFDIVQTVDSLRLAQALGRHAQALGRVLETLVQVNTSGEASKSGVAPDETQALVEAVAGTPGLRLAGLMTIGSFNPDPEQGRGEFRLLAELARKVEARTGLALPWLSMGMSHDFEVAIEEGANLVRVGTAIFGPRRPGGG